MSARTAPDWPRLMRRTTAALYCDLSVADFERELAAGRLPMPVHFGGADHWNRASIDEYLDRLTGDRIPDWRSRAKIYQK